MASNPPAHAAATVIYRHLDGRRVVVAYHGLGDTFPRGTLGGMLNDIGWNEDDLRRLELSQE